jgi:hypothetical protein
LVKEIKNAITKMRKNPLKKIDENKKKRVWQKKTKEKNRKAECSIYQCNANNNFLFSSV